MLEVNSRRLSGQKVCKCWKAHFQWKDGVEMHHLDPEIDNLTFLTFLGMLTIGWIAMKCMHRNSWSPKGDSSRPW